MTNNAAVFLCDTGQAAGRIHEGHERDVEAITHADEAGHLVGGIDIDHACHDGGVLPDDTNAVTADTCQPYNGIARPIGLDLKERTLIDDLLDHLMHDIRLGWIDWHHAV